MTASLHYTRKDLEHWLERNEIAKGIGYVAAVQNLKRMA